MIILDTHVLSALMRTLPDAAVVTRLDRQPADSIWLTSITVFEARFGLGLLPKGRRRISLERAFDRVLEEDLSNRVLDFDQAAAASAALASRWHGGRPSQLATHGISWDSTCRWSTLGSRERARRRPYLSSFCFPRSI